MAQKAALSRFALAFIAGFVSVLLFHQGVLALLHAVNFTPRAFLKILAICLASL